MVVHVVIWKLKKIEDGARLKEAIETLSGKIPGLISIESGININGSVAAGDLVLISKHIDEQALADYQVNPLHVAVKNQIVEAVSSSTVVDFTT